MDSIFCENFRLVDQQYGFIGYGCLLFCQSLNKVLRLTSPPVLLVIILLTNLLWGSLSNYRSLARPENHVGGQR
jgi:hypothetical protein